LLPTDAANAGAADVLGRQYSPPIAIAPLLLWLLLLLLQLPWGVGLCIGICFGVCRRCRRHCHGGNLAVTVAASAAVAAAIGGGRTRMVASQIFLAHYFLSQKYRQYLPYIKDQHQQHSAGTRQKIPSLLHTQNNCCRR
jgi:hypothetical protein